MTTVLDREVYSEAEAARLLRVPQSTLRYWLDGGNRAGRQHRPVIRLSARGDRAVTWAEFVDDIQPRQTADGWENDIVGAHAKDDLAGWQRLADGLAPATELVTIADLEPFQRWAPLIARFSFLLSPYAGQDEPKSG